MRTSNFPAFEGRVIFEMRHLSLGNGAWIDRQLAKPQGVLDERIYRNMVFALGLTVNVRFEFRGDENPMLADLRDFWQVYQSCPDEDGQIALATQWRQETHASIMDAWIDAANLASAPFRDPAGVPGAALTPEEQEQARDATSPLASSGAKSGKRAAPVQETS